MCIILTKGRLSVATHRIFGITSPAVGGREAGRYLQLGRNETPPMFTIFRREMVASGFVYRCSDFPLTSLISRPGVGQGRVWVLVIGALWSTTPGRVFGISQAPTASSLEPLPAQWSERGSMQVQVYLDLEWKALARCSL